MVFGMEKLLMMFFRSWIANKSRLQVGGFLAQWLTWSQLAQKSPPKAFDEEKGPEALKVAR